MPDDRVVATTRFFTNDDSTGNLESTMARRGKRWSAMLLAAWSIACLVARTASADPCAGGDDVAFLVSPRGPIVGRRVQILAASERGGIGDLVVTAPAGAVVTGTLARRGGPPWSAALTFAAAQPGAYEVAAMRDGVRVGCARFTVGDDERRGRAAAPSFAAGWDRAAEALYAAWIEHLFAAPPDASLSFDSLQDVLTNPDRNILFGHLGLGEDEATGALGAPPDCADLPYALRTYFAWKIGLPVGFRSCSRGTASAPPTCGQAAVVTPAGADARTWYGRTARRIMDTVHSGSARTALDDDATDFYPVALTRTALRPGTVYADPFGHTLMIVQWVPQTDERSGMLFAVDAQPDNSVARKRFWEGTFLFANDVRSAGPGFKAFRPLIATGDRTAPLDNAALADDARFAPYSSEQATLAPDDFYARIGRLIDPDGLRPLAAYDEMLAALVEQLTTRVDSVQRGEDYLRAHPPETIAMPSGAAIFETIGPWEDYATPSRDLRLQIAMKVLLDLPERLGRHPELYVLDGRPAAEARLLVEQRHADAIAKRQITYTRSDGSPWRLTVADILARRSALEMAYDPNDCIEIRWGAEPGSDEYATCRRHAPAEQRARMEDYRVWFHEGRRPGR
jgi:hypothetical protein